MGMRASGAAGQRGASLPAVRSFFMALAGLMLMISAPARADEATNIAASHAMSLGEIGDWIFGCDNRGWCVIVGHADVADPNHITGDNSRSLAIRIEMTSRGRIFSAEFIPDQQINNQLYDGISWSQPFIMPWRDHNGATARAYFARQQLSSTEAAALLRQLRRGRRFVVPSMIANANVELRFPYVGFAAAEQELNRRRRAIARWRASRIMHDSPVTLSVAAPIMVSGAPAVTAMQMDWCSSGIDADNLSAYDLRGGWRLWQHHCPVGEDNQLSRWYIQAPDQSGSTILILPREGGPSTARSGASIPNATFDFDFGVLRSHRTARAGREDCGLSMVWGWTGSAFVLLERRIMPWCHGLSTADWIPTFRRDSSVRRVVRP